MDTQSPPPRKRKPRSELSNCLSRIVAEIRDDSRGFIGDCLNISCADYPNNIEIDDDLEYYKYIYLVKNIHRKIKIKIRHRRDEEIECVPFGVMCGQESLSKYIDGTPCINYGEMILHFMWQSSKDEPKMKPFSMPIWCVDLVHTNGPVHNRSKKINKERNIVL
jgi:hypothetical protein